MDRNVKIVCVGVFGVAFKVLHLLEEQTLWALKVLLNVLILIIDVDFNHVFFGFVIMGFLLRR